MPVQWYCNDKTAIKTKQSKEESSSLFHYTLDQTTCVQTQLKDTLVDPVHTIITVNKGHCYKWLNLV